MPGKNLKLADKFAQDYDHSIVENNWHGPEIVFNAAKEYLKPNSKILDLGIGTGKSSVRFQNAGHIITGLDGSIKMLMECDKKEIGTALLLHDLENAPFPLDNNYFEAVISNGVFHLVYPLSPIFSEVSRMLKAGGYFVFTFENTNETKGYLEIEPGIWETKTQSEVLAYKHSEKYITELLLLNDFEIIAQSIFLAYKNMQLQKEYFFTLIVAQLN